MKSPSLYVLVGLAITGCCRDGKAETEHGVKPIGGHAAPPLAGTGGHAAPPRELLLGRALASLLQARQAYGNEFDGAIAELLRIQCKGIALPAGLQVGPHTIDAFFPMKELPAAEYAFCGSMLLGDGRTVIAPGFSAARAQ